MPDPTRWALLVIVAHMLTRSRCVVILLNLLGKARVLVDDLSLPCKRGARECGIPRKIFRFGGEREENPHFSSSVRSAAVNSDRARSVANVTDLIIYCETNYREQLVRFRKSITVAEDSGRRN